MSGRDHNGLVCLLDPCYDVMHISNVAGSTNRHTTVTPATSRQHNTAKATPSAVKEKRENR